jgi:threonine dehydratase
MRLSAYVELTLGEGCCSLQTKGQQVRDTSELLSISLAEVVAASTRLAGVITRTSLESFGHDATGNSILLKMENRQIGASMKARGAMNAALLSPATESDKGLVTVSSGNMGRAVAWAAHEFGVQATVGIPIGAPQVKVDALEGLGARILYLTPDQWWVALKSSHLTGAEGAFISPVLNRDVIAGAATVALEVFEVEPNVAAIFLPFGGGALALGTALVRREMAPHVRVIACEPEVKAPLTSSMRAGHEVSVTPGVSLVDAAGGPRLLPNLWPLFNDLIDASIAVPDSDTARAIAQLEAAWLGPVEGAGAISVAAALNYRGIAGTDTGFGEVQGPRVCVVSGGNMDAQLRAEIVEQQTRSQS